jgi:hypothetical protein
MAGSRAVSSFSTPPSEIGITGPISSLTGHPETFTATVAPISTTLPLTTVWEATDQLPVTRTEGLSTSVDFTWTVSGTKTITATATNAGGEVSATHVVTLAVPALAINIEGEPPEIVLRWDPVAGAVEHRVYRSSEPYFILSAENRRVTTIALGYQDTGALDVLDSYFYVVTAVNGLGVEFFAFDRVGKMSFDFGD